MCSSDLVVEALDAICRRIDLAARALATQIELLAEHRQALITAAVSGEHPIKGAP